MTIQRKSVAAPGAYPAFASPNITFDFEPKKITFVLYDTGAGKTAEISLDGSSDHVTLSTDNNIKQYECVQRVTKAWVKGTGAPNVVAVAES